MNSSLNDVITQNNLITSFEPQQAQFLSNSGQVHTTAFAVGQQETLQKVAFQGANQPINTLHMSDQTGIIKQLKSYFLSISEEANVLNDLLKTCPIEFCQIISPFWLTYLEQLNLMASNQAASLSSLMSSQLNSGGFRTDKSNLNAQQNYIYDSQSMTLNQDKKKESLINLTPHSQQALARLKQGLRSTEMQQKDINALESQLSTDASSKWIDQNFINCPFPTRNLIVPEGAKQILLNYQSKDDLKICGQDLKFSYQKLEQGQESCNSEPDKINVDCRPQQIQQHQTMSPVSGPDQIFKQISQIQEKQSQIDDAPQISPANEDLDLDYSEENSKDYVKMAFSKKSNYLLVPPDWQQTIKIKTEKKTVKRYRCRIRGCEGLFKRKCNLRDHFRKHTNMRPYQCPGCSKSFTQSGNLGRHLKNIHGVEEDEAIAQLQRIGRQNYSNDIQQVYLPKKLFGNTVDPQQPAQLIITQKQFIQQFGKDPITLQGL